MPTDMAESGLVAAPVTPFDVNSSSANSSRPHSAVAPQSSSQSGSNGLAPPVAGFAASQAGRSSDAGTTGHSLPEGSFSVTNPDHDRLLPPGAAAAGVKGHTGPIAPSASGKGGPSSEASAAEDRPVHQHRDGGRAPVEQEVEEVPPAYGDLARGPSTSRRPMP
jgi:hypothetical protein